VRYTYNDEDNRVDFCPAGVYAGTIKWADDTKLSQKGDQQLNVRWVMDDNGAGAFDRLTFSEKAGWRIDTFLKATGHQPEGGKGAQVDLTAQQVMGWRAYLNVGVEDDKRVQGKKINVIINYVTDRGVPPALPESATQEKQGGEPF
jgi:hypothetical protein